jgi:L-2-hydroxyglutarate oxidase LhgO
VAIETADFLIIGGGIAGLSIARELRRRERGAKIVLIEKERAPGLHASGRNSGVLHAGFYYSPDSLKARFTRDGNARLTEYCIERGIAIRRCGKLVVARSESDLAPLDALYRRGIANGVRLEMVSAEDARGIEPRAKVHQRAIWSPTTSSVDASAVMTSMHDDARRDAIDVQCETEYRGLNDRRIITSNGILDPGFVVNAAGLYADAVARDFGCARSHRILPFRGNYLLSSGPPDAFRTHIYPVPDPAFPFLGVHITLTVAGTAKIGPTAIPALAREHYGGLRSLRPSEMLEIVPRLTKLIATDRAVRAHAQEELRKLSRKGLVEMASSLAHGLNVNDFRQRGRAGIRAQLYDIRRGALEMDFVIETTERSLHVLNAVSPAFTCAFPFAEHVVNTIL